MSQRERMAFRRPREGDLEKAYRARFQEYEAWRASQVEAALPQVKPAPEEKKKKGGFGRLDLLFLALGFLVALFWRGCSQPK